MAAGSDRSDEGDYTVPETFLNLDEAVAPQPHAADANRQGVVFRDSYDRSEISSLGEDVRVSEYDEKDLGPHAREHSLEASVSTEKDRPRVSPLHPLHPMRESFGHFSNIVEENAIPPPVKRNPTPHSATFESRIGAAVTTGPSQSDNQEKLRLPELAAAGPPDHATTGGNSSIWVSDKRKRVSKFATTAYTSSYLIFFSILGTLARLGLQALTAYPGSPVTTPVVWANFAGSLIMGFLAEDRRLFSQEWGEEERRYKYSTKRERRALQRQDRELIKSSKRYSRTIPAPRPFTSSNTAQLFPVNRNLSSRRRYSMPSIPGGYSEPSIVSESTAPNVADPAEERKRHGAVKKTIPLYIGLATGFCGSLTSFSSFMRDAFLALSDSTPSIPNGLNNFSTSPAAHSGGYSFLSLLGVLIYEPAISIGGLYVGAHLSIALDPWTPTLPFSFTRKVLDRVVAVLAFGAWAGAVILACLPPDRPGGPAAGSASTWNTESWRSVIFAVVLAPLGCLLRFYVSLILNPVLPAFPLGTFVVNIGGSLLEATLYDLQHVKLHIPGGVAVGGGLVGCQVLQGAMDGFCGCLTTVSTWVAELSTLRRGHAWRYGVASAVIGVLSMIVVMGPVRWTVGFSEGICVP